MAQYAHPEIARRHRVGFGTRQRRWFWGAASILCGCRPELGFEPGRSLPFATPTQELVWEDDTLAAIEQAFHRLAPRIECRLGQAYD